MKILIFVSGTHMPEGLDSPSAGEGRWAMGLAKLLAQEGHQLHCVGGTKWNHPSWGSTQPLPNVTLSHTWPQDQEFDLVLYTPWENLDVGSRGNYGSCRTLPIKAKWYVHCQFGWGDSIATDHDCYDHNHFLAYPYIQDEKQWFTTKNPYKTFPLPIPVYSELAPLALNERKTIIWSAKGVFHQDWPLDHHVPRMGGDASRALLRLSKEIDFNLVFLDGKYLSTHHGVNSGAAAALSALPNKTIIDGLIPRNDLLNIMQRSRVAIIISGLLGSFAENIASGCVPLCYDGHIYRESAKKHGIKLDIVQATEEDIYQVVKKLYTDDLFWGKVILDYRKEIEPHGFSACRDYFSKMLAELNR
jgi:hypothetical protein